MVGGECFQDFGDFLDTFDIPEPLSPVREFRPPRGIFMDERSLPKLFEVLWSQDPEQVKGIFGVDDVKAGNVYHTLMKRLHVRSRRSELSVDDDVYSNEYGRLIHELASTFHVHGSGALVSYVNRSSTRDPLKRGIMYGFLKAAGAEGNLGWKFTDEEKRFGDSLLADIMEILKSTENYSEKVKSLMLKGGFGGH